MNRDHTDRASPPANSGAEDWQRPSPFAMLFFAASTIKFVIRALQAAFLPWLALFLTMRDDTDEMRSFVIFLWAFAGLIVVAVAAYSVTQWVCFRFRIGTDRLLIRRGFIRKSTLDMPFERVQGMNIERSPVDRIVGLVTVTLDTSGSAQAEGSLPSLKTEVADLLRARVARRRQSGEETGDAGQDATERGKPGTGGMYAGYGADVARMSVATAASEGPAGRRRMLLKLTAADLIRIGLANRNFIFVAAIAGLVADLISPGVGLEPILELLAQGAESAAGSLSGLGALARLALAAVVLLVLLAGAFVLTVTAALLRHYNFTLWHSGGGSGGIFRSRAGLLTQREVVVRSVRIQQLSVSQDPVLRCFGRFRMRALPAATIVAQSGQAPGGLNLADTLEVPILRGRSAEELRALAFGREAGGIAVLPGDGRFKRVSPWFIRVLALRFWLVAGVMLGFAFAEWGPPDLAGNGWVTPWLTWWLALLPVATLAGWQLWRRRGYLHDDDGLASRRGFLGKTVDACLMRKAQSVVLKQSPLQRRKGLATVVVRLACGKVVVPYIDEWAARRLHDHIVYRVESSRERWH